MKRLLSILLASASSLYFACSNGEAIATAQDPAARKPAFDFKPGGAIPDERLGDYHVAMQCAVDDKDVGTLTIALWAKETPITTRNFLRLCDQGFYDGVTFHRILRNFMVQGGDPTGTGGGNSPYGTIQAEFSEAPERAHAYGVLSMARKGGEPNSASCQFFLCCDDGPGVWGLDGQYASFGRITSGVATLEALADVPVRSNGRGENSAPTKPAVITRAEVKKGPAPAGETIARPAPDLGGEPRTVVIQHALVAFKGAPQMTATRSKEEAEALAQQLVERARAGEDFSALVREFSADPIQPGDETPGTYRLNNRGVRDLQEERAFYELDKRAKKELDALTTRLAAGEVTRDDVMKRQGELKVELQAAYNALSSPRDKMVKGFGDVAFSLEVGGVGVAVHDAQKSPYGWHVIKRLE